MSSSVYVDNKKKDILIFGKGPTQGLDGTTLTAEKLYSIYFTENNKRFCLSLHYNDIIILLQYNNSYLLLIANKLLNLKLKTLKL